MSGLRVLSPFSGIHGLHHGNEPGILGVMASHDNETRRIRDPVHGLIVFGGSGDSERDETDRIAWRLLDTREFQRLRRIRQLGFSDLVFPGATHSRFAHSIGVYHTARFLADIIARRQGRRDAERERVALLAALLHDIGHGPFSHVFESVGEEGPRKGHEDWGAEIVKGKTEVNCVLREIDKTLPGEVAALLKADVPTDIYASIVSSQLDADRLDYVRRDRLATGVNFAHIDCDWLFDCLDVGTITIGEQEPYEVPCFFLNPKGLHIAEEYLEARFRLYRMVYMHKTTRAAEKMLETVLARVNMADSSATQGDPLLQYLTASTPTLGAYLALDDSAIWAALAILAEENFPGISEIARRLRNRQLYKCVDVGTRGEPGGNFLGRFRKALKGSAIPRRDEVLYDDPTVTPYKLYDFLSTSALNKVLVKPRSDMPEPVDVLDHSPTVQVLKSMQHRRLTRIYAPDAETADAIRNLLREVEDAGR